VEEDSALHGRLAHVVSRLNDEVDALGATVGVAPPADGPSVYHMSQRGGSDLSGGSDSDGMSADSTTFEDDDSGLAQATQRPLSAASGVAPEPQPREDMADGTKREAPPADPSAQQWASTGDRPHGPGAWRRGAQRASDGEADPPRNRRRIEEDEAAEMEGAV
jgi:hypothetical protein